MGKLDEKRRELREQIIGHIMWAQASDINAPLMEGTIMDVSKSGMSIFTHKQVSEGDILKVYGEGLWEGAKIAVVKWSRELAPEIYRAGLTFKS